MSLLDTICYVTKKEEYASSLSTYRAHAGYHALEKIIREKIPPQQVVDTVRNSGLRGRGGAGFPTGVKWGFFPQGCTEERYVVCNSDESEPGSCKDRDILMYNPHAVIEGMAIACYALSAKTGYNYIRGEFADRPFHAFQQALHEALQAGYLGENILRSNISITIEAILGAGAYICGEETALLESLEGNKGLPRFKPPFPAQYGLYGAPTVVNNTETLASVPSIVRNGAEWFVKLGVENSAGLKCFSLSGHVNKPGNYELPLGTPFAELLEIAGGVWKGRQLKAVIPGGSSAPVVPSDVMMGINMDYDSLTKVGSMLGSGGVIVMDETTCMVRALERISRFYYAESCGQCTPCREGTGWLYRMVSRIERGEGREEDLDRLDAVARKIEGHTICAFGDAAAWPVRSFLRHFRSEFEQHIQNKCCPMQHN